MERITEQIKAVLLEVREKFPDISEKLFYEFVRIVAEVKLHSL